MACRSVWWGIVIFLAYSTRATELRLQVDSINGDGLTSAVSRVVNEAFEDNKRGLDALAKKDLDLAMGYFDKALAVYPDYSDAANNRGVVFFRKGDVAEAQQIWEDLAKKDPSYAVASFNLGLVYLHDQQRDAAMRLFERALNADKRFVEAYVRLGAMYVESGDREKGLEYLQKAYKISPDHPDAWSFLAHALVANGDTSGAISLLKKHENELEALKMLGRIEAARRDFSKAADYFDRAVAKGADPSLLLDLAQALTDNNNGKEALGIIKNYFGCSANPAADGYLLGGIASKECGDIGGAAHYFEQGTKKFPADDILKYNLGQVYFFQKKFDKAENVWGEISDTAQDPSLYYLRALDARRRNDLQTAEQFIKRAIASDGRAEFYDLLGVIEHLKGDDRQAREDFKKALKIDPECRSAQLDLALIGQSSGELAQIASQYEQRLSGCQVDSCATIAFQLSIVLYHLNQIDKAAKVLSSLRDDQMDERVYRHLAIYYRELHDWDHAITALETARKRFVVDPQTEYDLAETYLLAGRQAKAAEQFQELLSKWQQNPWRIYYQLGYACLEMNEFDKAKDYFQKSLQSKADNVAARGLLAFVLNREGNVAKARELWEQTLKDDPSNVALLVNMGLSYEKDGKYEQALEYYKKAAMNGSNDPGLSINIGNAYSGLERFTDAISAYTQALSSPKRDLAAYDIYLAAQKEHDSEKARKMYELLHKEFPAGENTARVESEIDLTQGDTAQAIETLETLGEKEPADFFALARLYALRGNSEKTEEALAKLPDEPQWKKVSTGIEAQLAYQRKDYQKSLDLWHQSGDTTFALRYNMALAAYQAKSFQEALDIAGRIIGPTTGADRSDVCTLAGNAAFALKHWEDARHWYLQLSTLQGNNAIVQYNCAVIAYNLGDIDDSWGYYQRARELDPSVHNKDIEGKYLVHKGINSVSGSGAALDSVDLWYNQAVDLQEHQKDTAAEILYLKVVARNPLQSQAWNNLGALYGKHGEIDKAISAYQKAVEKKHDLPETYANLINLYIVLEDFKNARVWMIKGIGHNPDSQLLQGLQSKITEGERKAAKHEGEE